MSETFNNDRLNITLIFAIVLISLFILFCCIVCLSCCCAKIQDWINFILSPIFRFFLSINDFFDYYHRIGRIIDNEKAIQESQALLDDIQCMSKLICRGEEQEKQGEQKEQVDNSNEPQFKNSPHEELEKYLRRHIQLHQQQTLLLKRQGIKRLRPYNDNSQTHHSLTSTSTINNRSITNQSVVANYGTSTGGAGSSACACSSCCANTNCSCQGYCSSSCACFCFLSDIETPLSSDVFISEENVRKGSVSATENTTATSTSYITAKESLSFSSTKTDSTKGITPVIVLDSIEESEDSPIVALVSDMIHTAAAPAAPIINATITKDFKNSSSLSSTTTNDFTSSSSTSTKDSSSFNPYNKKNVYLSNSDESVLIVILPPGYSTVTTTFTTTATTTVTTTISTIATTTVTTTITTTITTNATTRDPNEDHSGDQINSSSGVPDPKFVKDSEDIDNSSENNDKK